MGDSLENQDTSVETQNVAVVDYGEFANYILKAASILLPEEDIHAVPPALAAALEEKVNQDCIRKFLSDPQIPALYVQRSCSKGKRKNILRLMHIFHCICTNPFFFVQFTTSYSIFLLFCYAQWFASMTCGEFQCERARICENRGMRRSRRRRN